MTKIYAIINDPYKFLNQKVNFRFQPNVLALYYDNTNANAGTATVLDSGLGLNYNDVLFEITSDQLDEKTLSEFTINYGGTIIDKLKAHLIGKVLQPDRDKINEETEELEPFSFNLVADLNEAKDLKKELIDKKTKDLIGQGFETPTGEMLSLSLEAQANWERYYNAQDSSKFPIGANTIDNKQLYFIHTLADFNSLFEIAQNRKDDILRNGTLLKNYPTGSVEACTTIQEVYDFSDNRV